MTGTTTMTRSRTTGFPGASLPSTCRTSAAASTSRSPRWTPRGRTKSQGAGLGYVDVFSPSGKLLRRFEHGPWLNAPWGLALAPGDFGAFSHNLLVGQFGSGEIAAYDVASGRFVGTMLDPTGAVLSIDGLWALSFGNGGDRRAAQHAVLHGGDQRRGQRPLRVADVGGRGAARKRAVAAFEPGEAGSRREPAPALLCVPSSPGAREVPN